MRIFFREKLIFAVMGAFIPFILGWQNVDLRAYLNMRKLDLKYSRESEAKKGDLASVYPGLTPYRILEKSTMAFNALLSVHIDMETWFETPLFHIKTSIKSEIEKLHNHKTDARVGISMLQAGGMSTSQWLQSYEINGIAFTWDPQERQWQQEELKISDKEANKVLEYSVLQSLFVINERIVSPDSISFLCLEKRNGRDCFVLRYSIDNNFFERHNTVGNIAVKAWIDTETFLPVSLRSEGEYGYMYMLQIVDYSGFNSSEKFTVPSDVSKGVAELRSKLKAKIDHLISAVASIRKWERLDSIKVEFCDTISLQDFLVKQMDKDYTKERFNDEGFLFKWLGLLHKDADYRESLINEELSSIAGVYDPQGKRILLGDWIHPVVAEVILVHEITHAFQDVHLDLEKFMEEPRIYNNFDMASAHSALLEGEATAVMLEYLAQKDGRSFKDLENINTLIEDKLFKASDYAKENIYYNLYGYGTSFIQSYLEKNDWNGLDAIYKKPPRSMEEIMHPFKYTDEIRDDLPEKNSLEAELPGGWKQEYAATLGELMVSFSLRQFLDREVAENAATGWGRDNIVVYRKNNSKAVVFFSEWDSDEDAAEFFEAFRSYLKKRYTGLSCNESGKYFFSKSSNKQVFSCKLENKIVKIIWFEKFNLVDFKSLVRNIYFRSAKGPADRLVEEVLPGSVAQYN